MVISASRLVSGSTGTREISDWYNSSPYCWIFWVFMDMRILRFRS